jgi:hypothetical protein
MTLQNPGPVRSVSETTWSPTLTLSGGLGTGTLTSSLTGSYAQMVTNSGTWTMLDIGGTAVLGAAGTASGNLQINLPVTASANMGTQTIAALITSSSGTTPPGGSGQPFVYAAPSSANLLIETLKPASSAVTAWGASNSFTASGSITYTFDVHMLVIS